MGTSRTRLRFPSPAMAVALVALFLSLGGIGLAATGGNFILGHSNRANRKTSLTGSPTSGAALAVDNATSGLPAASFNVTQGTAPFAVNSSAKVSNLNADQLDGLSSGAFARKSDIVRLSAPSLLFGQSQSWDIGPVITLTASCSTSGGINHLTLSLLNNTPGTGEWFLGDLIYPGDKPQINPATAWTRSGVVQSGLDQLVTESVDPPSTTSSTETASHTATMTWWDNTGETITVNYVAIAYAHFCSIVGTSVRAT